MLKNPPSAKTSNQLIHNHPSLLSLERTSRCIPNSLSVMTHELRTPLSIIAVAAEWLMEHKNDPLMTSHHRFIENIYQSASHMMAVINTVLDLSRVEAGRLELRPEPISLPKALATGLNQIRPLADMKRLTLTLHTEDAPATLIADPTCFTQILLNLLSNAVTFTPDGGRILVTAKTVPYCTLHAPDVAPDTQNSQAIPRTAWWVEIAVTDTGIGIKAEDLPKLFQPFTQLMPHHRGTGLGLALVKRLIDLHGGQVEAASSGIGCGSTFTMRLPMDSRPLSTHGDEGLYKDGTG